jgi:mannitol 2-dehydrogenase
MSPTPLSRRTLPELSTTIHRPAYDPADIRPGIVHIGLGGFHRAHMARYTHELMEQDPAALAWGIAGAGILPADERMHDALAPQDGLYTLIERSASEERVSIIGSIAEVIYAGETTAALLDAIDRPETRIVSITVSENGYLLDPATRKLNLEHPLIKSDLAAPETPRTVIGILVEAFRRRLARDAPLFTALTCDNIQHNGNVLRESVLTFARLRDPHLATRIDAGTQFPNTMVDRITPVTAQADIAYLAEKYGIADNWPVFCETFTQWVIEDRFVAGRPEWERVGAQFVGDVTPYELMKLRLLNGSHLAVSGVGRLIGYEFIHEAMANPLITRMMAALMERETAPTLAPVPGIDLADYQRTLIARFANPAIRDTVERVNTDAPLNVLVVPIRARLDADAPLDILALALAAWLRRVRGTDEQGQTIDIRHPLADLLRAKAEEGGSDPRPLLGITTLFGGMGTDPRLVGPASKYLASLYEIGAQRTLEKAAEELRF